MKPDRYYSVTITGVGDISFQAGRPRRRCSRQRLSRAKFLLGAYTARPAVAASDGVRSRTNGDGSHRCRFRNPFRQQTFNRPNIFRACPACVASLTRSVRAFADQLTPEALGAWQKAEITKWWPILKAAHVQVDQRHDFRANVLRLSRGKTGAHFFRIVL